MTTDDEALAIVTTAATEVEGQLLANILNEHGIRAVITGGATSEFRAQAPGAVKVVVKQVDLSAAETVLEQRAQRGPHSDWTVEDKEASMCQCELSPFGTWSLMIGESLVSVGIVAYLAMSGNVFAGFTALVVSVAISAAVLARLLIARAATRSQQLEADNRGERPAS